ncbi:DUF2969 family protein [Periweissella ghanensis]|uniref:DUF2969 domain-containing protein n=1 Tax=Periweissella ghanensis TaxID=467997 RepID=A0ABM8ZBX8_9LACO|nr:DUF2969 family protein [Periweissella ghanensis]MCM0601581.1 DUF2969 family protein [Periweissella ghanensis]CAH0418658.1 hypothetical protein WGH24286_01088 [Periweissella ghanensis]
MGKKDRTVPVTLEEQKNGALDVMIGKRKIGQITSKEDGVVAKFEDGGQLEGKSFDEVLGQVIAEYNLHS